MGGGLPKGYASTGLTVEALITTKTNCEGEHFCLTT